MKITKDFKEDKRRGVEKNLASGNQYPNIMYRTEWSPFPILFRIPDMKPII